MSDSEVEIDDGSEQSAGVEAAHDSGSDFTEGEAEASATEEDSESSDFDDEENVNPKSKGAKGKGKQAATKKGGAAAKKAAPAPKKAPAAPKATKAAPAANKRAAPAAKSDALASLPKKKRATKAGDGESVASTASAGSKKTANSTKVPAKGGDKVKAVSEVEAPAYVLDYVNKQNRPYSVLNIFENLHGAVKKASLTRVLDKLADEGKIHAKTYGKSKVYYPDQAQYGEIQETDISSLQEEVKELTTKQNEVKNERKRLEQEVSSLQSSLTTEQLGKSIEELKKTISEKEAKLERLNEASGGEVVTKDTRKNIIAEVNKYRKTWVDRKNKVMDLVDNMSEGTGKKPKEIMEEAGIETDEEMGINVRDFKFQT
eukprot:gb/GECG01005990.1/.p1 GENE.gb/GECG01005990.1/~~gb/GECG01005990.1/.p1  ORF type:complete len:373 (+),score=102.62 gb/GECG01005990.1/:1-1119(+)